MLKAPRLVEALRKAVPHVQRQVFAGKHEQDRADAKAWLDEFKDVVAELQPWTRENRAR